MENKKIIAIDGNSLVYRAFYALPPLMTKDGLYTNGVYGFINMLNKITKDYQPEYIVVAFDKKAPTFRHLEYSEYKAGRKKTPLELLVQFPIIKDVLNAMNIKILEMDGFEADDLIGTVVKRAEDAGLKPMVISGDKDELQLVSTQTKVLITKKGISEFDLYDMEAMKERYGITPTQFIDLKGLMGDSSDNIPGIPGVGEKTGLLLIHQFGTVEEIIQRAQEIKSEKLRGKVIENAQLALMSRKLSEINTNVPIEINFSQFHFEQADFLKLEALYSKLELYSLLAKLRKEKQETSNISGDADMFTENKICKPKEQAMKTIILEESIPPEFLKALENHTKAVIKVFGDHNHKGHPSFIGMSIFLGETYFYIASEHLLRQIASLMNEKEIGIIGHNLKNDYFTLIYFGFTKFQTEFDTAIAQYVIEPERNRFEISTLVSEFLGEEMVSETDFMKNNNQLDLFSSQGETYGEYGHTWCQKVIQLEHLLRGRLTDLGLDEVYYELELPLIEIFAFMEVYGFHVDKAELLSAGKALTNQIKTISEKIYEFAGEEFNINSPKQLGPILFEKLGLPTGKKTKTGYSTGAEILEKIRDHHEIVPLILEYRMLSKLNSTYVEGILPLIHADDKKIHAHFQQTGTATGRISCSEPNLQNIPIKQELGRTLRKAFIPDNDQCVLVGADYSQIELRVLAHLCQDETLIEGFNRGEDVHKITASKVFDIPLDQVSSIQRSRAKAVNFGVIYGMSDWGLSENLHISKKEAASYIEEYFKKYNSVKAFMEGQVESCKQLGYAVTIKNRKRNIPELLSSNFMVRQLGERLAMNTPIQGSAADIIKIAMIKVFDELRSRQLKSKLILQVHDELIINTYHDEVEVVCELLKRNMMDAVKLSVTLDVGMEIGDNWYELK